MTEQNPIAKIKILGPIMSPLDDDAGNYRVQLLPTGLDIAKAMFVLMIIAAAAPTASRYSYRWLQYVQEAAESGHFVAVSDGMDSAAARRPVHVQEKHAKTSDNQSAKRQPPRLNLTDKVEEISATGNSVPSPPPGRKVSSCESPPNYQATKQAVVPRMPKQKDSPRIVFFDNAGRSYLTKAERNVAEARRLAESLRRYPAMKSEQHAIMRQRAFARLEMLDAQQR